MSSPLQPVTRSVDFWFDDGNIVLQVETKQFRIHRGLICANSVVFRDMHALSQPEERDTIDGCPVVLLQGDTEADWINLLEYIYFPAKASQDGDHLSFPRVASMLRLGSKYEFAEIRSLALRIIHTQVPIHSLEAWDNVFNPDRRWMPTSSGMSLTPVGCIPGDWLVNNEFDLLNLAIEQDLQTILPVAYYLCIHEHSLKDILCGIKQQDGMLSTVRASTMPTLLLGRQCLHDMYYERSVCWLSDGAIPTISCAKTLSDPPTEDPQLHGMTLCQLSRMCGLAAWSAHSCHRRLAQEIPVQSCLTLEVREGATADQDNIGALDMLEIWWIPGFCDQCMDKIKEISGRQRQKVWQDLPSYFNLPRWSQLKDRE